MTKYLALIKHLAPADILGELLSQSVVRLLPLQDHVVQVLHYDVHHTGDTYDDHKDYRDAYDVYDVYNAALLWHLVSQLFASTALPRTLTRLLQLVCAPHL